MPSLVYAITPCLMISEELNLLFILCRKGWYIAYMRCFITGIEFVTCLIDCENSLYMNFVYRWIMSLVWSLCREPNPDTVLIIQSPLGIFSAKNLLQNNNERRGSRLIRKEIPRDSDLTTQRNSESSSAARCLVYMKKEIKVSYMILNLVILAFLEQNNYYDSIFCKGYISVGLWKWWNLYIIGIAWLMNLSDFILVCNLNKLCCMSPYFKNGTMLFPLWLYIVQSKVFLNSWDDHGISQL